MCTPKRRCPYGADERAVMCRAVRQPPSFDGDAALTKSRPEAARGTRKRVRMVRQMGAAATAGIADHE